MNKWKALIVGLVFLVAAASALPTEGYFFGVVLMVIGTGYLAIAGNKFLRDWLIVREAETKRLVAAEKTQAPPAMSSPGSKRLFVPQPLKYRKEQ